MIGKNVKVDQIHGTIRRPLGASQVSYRIGIQIVTAIAVPPFVGAHVRNVGIAALGLKD